MSEVGRERLISGKKTECDFFSKPYLGIQAAEIAQIYEMEL